MSKLKEEEILGQIDTWLACCKNDAKRVYGGRKKCPCQEICEQAYQQIREMIKGRAEQEEIEARYIDIVIDLYDQLEQMKPQVTEEWYEEKAIELYNLLYYKTFNMQQVKDSIHSLVEEIPAKKATVDEEFVEKMVEESVYVLHKDMKVFYERKLKEVGVEVVGK